jgi:hypothetical protein
VLGSAYGFADTLQSLMRMEIRMPPHAARMAALEKGIGECGTMSQHFTANASVKGYGKV